MDTFLKNFGLFAIFFLIAYGYKKIQDNHELKRMGLHEDEKVYMAADEFVCGAPSDEVKGILDSCFEFDGQDADVILARAIPHRADKDGGYRAFIRSVNKVVGDELYDEKRRPPTKPAGMNPPISGTEANSTITVTPCSGKSRRLSK